MTTRWTVALALFLLPACAVLQPEASVDRIVAEALGAARAPAAEQKAALAAAQGAFTRDPGTLNRLRLATLLAVLAAPLRDDARAAELYEPLANPSSPGPGRFAALMSAQLAERQRLARERERADKEREKREEALRQQLEAVQSIERGILEREEKLRRRQR